MCRPDMSLRMWETCFYDMSPKLELNDMLLQICRLCRHVNGDVSAKLRNRRHTRPLFDRCLTSRPPSVIYHRPEPLETWPMASERYNAPVREKHWQQVWNEKGTFRTQDKSKKPKRYQLEMFPYPSGRVHMGHVRNYTLGDVMARYMRAKGFNVLHPMGWDAFGLPAENAAMERKVHPRKWTYENIDTMRGQLKAMGLSIDWEREFATCNPDYYVHQQRLFLDFLKKKLAYRKTAKVNWDPVENTVLANEQVIDGRGWRSGAVVEQRDLTQWFFKITAYAEELLEALDSCRQVAGLRVHPAAQLDRQVDRRQHAVRAGRRASCRRSCRRSRSSRRGTTPSSAPRSWRSRPSIRWPPHIAKKSKELAAFIEECRKIGTTEEALAKAEKKGFDTGIVAVHPFKPDVKLPVYVANFIVMGYGTGAIFGCPAHDQRDLDFARKYGRPVVPVVLPPGADPATFSGRRRGLRRRRHHDQFRVPRRAHHRGGQGQDRRPAGGARHRRAQGQLPHARLAASRASATGAARSRSSTARRTASCRCRYEQLPVQLPEDVTFDKPGNPLDHHPTWKHVACPKCGQPARARDRHHGHVRRQLLVPVPLLRAQRTDAHRQEGAQVLGARRPVHRRQGARGAAPALRALLHARHEGDQARARSTSRSRPCSRRASSSTRPTAARTATG